jgi:hypothetical protein
MLQSSTNGTSSSLKFQLKTAPKRKRPIESSNGRNFNHQDDNDKIEEVITHIIDGPTSFLVPLSNIPKEKPPLVIPLVEGFSKPESVDQRAVNEIINDLKNKSSNSETSSTLVIESIPSTEPADRKRPLLLASIAAELKGLETDEERFQRDMLLRADDMDVRSNKYKAVPVEEFGAALMRGMGWTGPTSEDQARIKKSEEPMMARESRLGLGAAPKPPDDKKKHKPNESKGDWQKKVEEKIKKQSLQVGDLVWLRSAIEAGKRAQIIATKGVPGLDKVRVRMELDGRVLEIHRKDVVLLSSTALEEVPYLQAYRDIPDAPLATEYKGLHSQAIALPEKASSKPPASSSGEQLLEKARDETSSSSSSSQQSNWLFPGIRVRIVSKHIGEKYYLQKGVVDDVHSSGSASIRLDAGGFLDSVKEKYLETVLPSVGGLCKILRGVNRGQHASLLEKKKEVGLAIVQLADDYELVQLSMDDIAALS